MSVDMGVVCVSVYSVAALGPGRCSRASTMSNHSCCWPNFRCILDQVTTPRSTHNVHYMQTHPNHLIFSPFTHIRPRRRKNGWSENKCCWVIPRQSRSFDTHSTSALFFPQHTHTHAHINLYPPVINHRYQI